jgi:hypothetical protein
MSTAKAAFSFEAGREPPVEMAKASGWRAGGGAGLEGAAVAGQPSPASSERGPVGSELAWRVRVQPPRFVSRKAAAFTYGGFARRPRNSLARTILMPRKVPRHSKSLSPLKTNSALPSMADSRSGGCSY